MKQDPGEQNSEALKTVLLRRGQVNFVPAVSPGLS